MSTKQQEVPPQELKDIFRTLQAICSNTFDATFDGDAAAMMAKSHLFVTDLQAWSHYLEGKSESRLFQAAEHEYMSALLSLVNGQYRNAFKGLRLVLELLVQGTYLSANLIELNEWLRSAKDTNWSVLIGADQEPDSEESSAAARGPFTKRFCDAFFPDIRDHAPAIGTMARTLYRELSETIHGNIPKDIPLPSSLEFDQETFSLWHKKAETTRLIGLFCLTCRYARQMNEIDRVSVEAGIMDQLGHIESIRIIFGGPET